MRYMCTLDVPLPSPPPPLSPEPGAGHAVARLRTARLAASAKPFVARGSGGGRCAGCRLIASHCLCASRPQLPRTRAGVCLVMGDIEALKPSNTGWLVADLVADTWAFGWSRTAVDPGLLALLADPQWQPYVVFPGEFVSPERVVTDLNAVEDHAPRKRPLFVLLDGTWSEARKMFRKSPYLDHLPVLSLHPEQVVSNYRLRRSARESHFCTSEVAALCLALAGEAHAADTLAAWLDVFTAHYLSVKRWAPLDRASEAHQRLQALAASVGSFDAGVR
jgi:DTW domain-containing protein YfiP